MTGNKETYKPDPDDISKVVVPKGDDFIGGTKTRHVVCAANRYKDLILAGARHYDTVMQSQLAYFSEEVKQHIKDCRLNGEYEQGFIDQWGNFMSREEAAKVVKMTGQKLYGNLPLEEKDYLFSEHLY